MPFPKNNTVKKGSAKVHSDNRKAPANKFPMAGMKKGGKVGAARDNIAERGETKGHELGVDGAKKAPKTKFPMAMKKGGKIC